MKVRAVLEKDAVELTTLLECNVNEVYGGQQYADIFMLESQIGYFAQKLVVTDKA